METSTSPDTTLFNTDRERRLWMWAIGVVVGIYSTLGLARTLADELRDRELLDAAFGVGVLVIVASVVIVSLRTRPRSAEIGVALGVVAVYGMVFLRMAIPEERTHLIEYSVVALLIHEALIERAGPENSARPAWRSALLAIAATALIGAVDEGVQAVLPSRVFDPVDILFNTLAAVMAVAASSLLRTARLRRVPG